MNDQEAQLFNAAVIGELRTAKLITDAMSGEKANDIATLYIAEWAKFLPDDGSAKDWPVVDSLIHFRNWLVTAPVIENVHITPVNITVTITIPVGTGGANVQVAMSAIPSEDIPNSVIEVYDLLVEAGNLFRTRRLGKSVAQPGSNANGSSPSGGSERIHITNVKVETRNGKTYYRCGGGRWEKFGVAAWPEVWKAAGIDPAGYSAGDNPVSFDAVIALNADGKPDKVTEIIAK